mmetsp:Transcript_3945/g.5950  ORF Transcript_3945/g.5950 Transcript_3945/m.5950 type:complete len:385 (-) Transcript_3945:810-1964(-)
MKEVYSHIEPLIIHVRPGANSNDLKNEIVNKLSSEHGFVNLDINQCTSGENERGTAIGHEYRRLVAQAKVIPADFTVKMLNKIIYCGQPKQNKFILSNFPDIIDQAKEFEKNCSQISAMIYPTGNSQTVEIKNNNLSLFNIDSFFQKEFRLKTMSEWSYQVFDEKLGNSVQYGVINGKSLSGKTTLCKMMADNLGYRVIDFKQIGDSLKSKLGTEEEPFEGEVPLKEIEKEIVKIINSAKGTNAKFVFDSFPHKEFAEFQGLIDQFGSPDFFLFLTTEEKAVKERWMKKNESEDFPEEQNEAIQVDSKFNKERRNQIVSAYELTPGRVNLMYMSTDTSLETTQKELFSKFSPKVILVNHEKRLGVDTTSANLAIKYNMIYISAY